MPAVKGQKYNIEPKPKIKQVFDKVVNNGQTVGEAVREVYQSKRNTTRITKSKSWEQLLKKHIPDSKLAKVLNEGLEAGKTVYKNNNSTKEIEEVGYEPDYAVRHKYLETGLKLKAKFPKEGLDDGNNTDIKNLIIVVNNILDGQGRATIKNI